MPDPVVAPAVAAPSPAAPAVAAAPVAALSAPVAAPAAPAVAPAAPSPPPVADGAAPPVVALEPAKPAEAPKPPATVIGEALAKKPAAEPTKPPEGAKPAEAAAPEGETKAPEGQSAEPAPPPAYEPFTLPEGASLDAERLGTFTKMLGDFEVLTKADHAAMQTLGQQLVDRHIAEVQDAVTRLNESYQARWDKQKVDWKDEFLKDPEIGGNRFQTSVDAALKFIRTHGGTEAQQAEFQDLMESSGLGNHPAMIRLLAKAGAAMSEGRPLAAASPPAAPKSKVDIMYGRKTA